MKRNYILIIIALFLSVAAISFLLWNKLTGKPQSIYDAIPGNAPFLIELYSGSDVDKAGPLGSLSNLFGAGEGFRILKKADSLMLRKTGAFLINETSPVAIAFLNGVSDKSQPLLLIKAGSRTRQKQMEEIIVKLFPGNSVKTLSRSESGLKIKTISASDGKTLISWVFSNGLLKAAIHAETLENAIREAKTISAGSLKGFSKIQKTVLQKWGITIYINHRYFAKVVTDLANSGYHYQTNEFGETDSISYSSMAGRIKSMSDWSGLDIKAASQSITLNGTALNNNSPNNFLRVFEGQGSSRQQAPLILPDSVAYYLSYTFAGKERFLSNLEAYFSVNDLTKKRELYFNRIEQETGVDFKSVLTEITDNEIITAKIRLRGDSAKYNKLLILHVTSNIEAERKLMSVIEARARLKMKKPEDYAVIRKDETGDTMRYSRFPYTSFAAHWLGQPFGLNDAAFFAFVGNYLVFTETSEMMEIYLKKAKTGITLSETNGWRKLKADYTIEKAHLNFYADFNLSYPLLYPVLGKKQWVAVEADTSGFFRSALFNGQIQWGDSLGFVTLASVLPDSDGDKMPIAVTPDLPYAGNKSDSIPKMTPASDRLKWKIMLRNPILTAPQIVVNHNDKQNREIIFQDNKLNVVLVTATGKIQWHFPVKEKILGEIKQIDYLKNNKLQYLFNTEDRIYLVDRNGKLVPPFPIDPGEKVTSGVSVFDYDNNKDYRFFISGRNRKVYGFDRSGKPLKGWEFVKTKEHVIHPVEHFRLNSADYLVLADASRLYIVDRKGKTRIKTEEKSNFSANKVYLKTAPRPALVYSQSDGGVVFQYFDGKKEELRLGKFSKNHFFECADMNGDGAQELVFFDKETISVFGTDGRIIATKKTGIDSGMRPRIVAVSHKMKAIVLVDSVNGLIRLYDYQGSETSGSPFAADSPANTGILKEKDKEPVLVTGTAAGELRVYSIKAD